ncbi:MAG: M48 family metallopeptidase [Planctomycetota bacterium]
MNIYAIVVLLALLGEYALHLTADLLNLRALRPELPSEFRDVYDAARYRRSQEYTRVRTRFGFLPATVELAALLAFWLAGGFRWLDDLLRGLGRGPIVTGLLFIAALVLAKVALGLPIGIYSTFGIEARFGFNKTTPRTFVLDHLKGLLLTVVLGVPLVAAVLWFFTAAGGYAWLWCWLATTAFSLVIHFVAPTWILPLFNRFTPLEAGELRDAVLAYARQVSFPLAGLFVIDGSRRSTKANAFFTGFGRHKRVALYDTLVASHSVPELVAVIAHEVGHYRRKHIVKSLVLGIAHAGVVFYLLSIFLTHAGLFAAFGIENPSVHAGLVFFGLLFAPLDLVLSFFLQRWSRKNELEADAFARETTGSGGPLAAALKKLSADNLSNLTPHPFYVALHHSHPPLRERVEALR